MLFRSLLPDILVSRYIKFPSASSYPSADDFIVIVLPVLANDEERSNNPIVCSIFTNKYAKRMAPQMRSHRSWWEGVWFFKNFFAYRPAIGRHRAL